MREVILTRVSAERYSATFEGRVVVASSRVPEFAAARALQRMGVSGEFYTRHAGASHRGMRLTVESAAKLTVQENDAHGPRFAPFVPFEGIVEA